MMYWHDILGIWEQHLGIEASLPTIRPVYMISDLDVTIYPILDPFPPVSHVVATRSAFMPQLEAL